MTENTGPEFLKQKYNLHSSPEVSAAALRTRTRTGEKVPQDPANQIQNYLDRFTGILERPDPEKRARGVDAFKHTMYDNFVIKPDEIPEGYFENQRRIAREQGHGNIEISEDMVRNTGGMWLDGSGWAGPRDGWDPDGGFVFSLGKSSKISI